jgi:hypothetical protein
MTRDPPTPDPELDEKTSTEDPFPPLLDDTLAGLEFSMRKLLSGVELSTIIGAEISWRSLCSNIGA